MSTLISTPSPVNRSVPACTHPRLCKNKMTMFMIIRGPRNRAIHATRSHVLHNRHYQEYQQSEIDHTLRSPMTITGAAGSESDCKQPGAAIVCNLRNGFLTHWSDSVVLGDAKYKYNKTTSSHTRAKCVRLCPRTANTNNVYHYGSLTSR